MDPRNLKGSTVGTVLLRRARRGGEGERVEEGGWEGFFESPLSSPQSQTGSGGSAPVEQLVHLLFARRPVMVVSSANFIIFRDGSSEMW